MFISVDKGTTYTKNNKGIMIRSTIRRKKENEIDLDENKIIIKYENEEYVIGEKGKFETDLEKASQEYTKHFILTSIGLSFNEEEIQTNLITGLPIALYANQATLFKELFNSQKFEHITINGKSQRIRIKKVEVFPEGAGAYYLFSYENALIVDIGGLSVDCGLFKKRNLEKFSTYKMGMMKLYADIANMLNSKYDLDLDEWDIEDIIKEKGLYISTENKTLDLKELKIDLMLKDHAQKIVDKLKLDYDLRTIENVLFTGGGSIALFEYINISQKVLLEDSQMNNAEGYSVVGRVAFNAE